MTKGLTSGAGNQWLHKRRGRWIFSLSFLFPLHSGSFMVHLILPFRLSHYNAPFFLDLFHSFVFFLITLSSTLFHTFLFTTTCSLHHFCLHIFLLLGSTSTTPKPPPLPPTPLPCGSDLCKTSAIFVSIHLPYWRCSPNDSSPLSHINNEKGESVSFPASVYLHSHRFLRLNGSQCARGSECEGRGVGGMQDKATTPGKAGIRLKYNTNSMPYSTFAQIFFFSEGQADFLHCWN